MGADPGHLFDEELQVLTDTINRVNSAHKAKQRRSISIVLSDSMHQRRSLVNRFLHLFH